MSGCDVLTRIMNLILIDRVYFIVLLKLNLFKINFI